MKATKKKTVQKAVPPNSIEAAFAAARGQTVATKQDTLTVKVMVTFKTDSATLKHWCRGGHHCQSFLEMALGSEGFIEKPIVTAGNERATDPWEWWERQQAA